MNLLSRVAADLQLMLKRPARLQFAALCYREGVKGTEILLITSRDTGRWVIPKGWPMAGKQAAEVAAREAFEEAGVEGEVSPKSIGTYVYQKKLKAGLATECRVKVFPVRVTGFADEFPELGQRRREWVSPRDAASRVDEPDLRQLISEFAA